MSTSQYAAQKKPKSHIIVLCAQLAVYLAAGFLAGWRTGAALCGCLAGYALVLRKAFRSLDGMNGDISGYALTLSELCGAAGAHLKEKGKHHGFYFRRRLSGQD